LVYPLRILQQYFNAILVMLYKLVSIIRRPSWLPCFSILSLFTSFSSCSDSVDWLKFMLCHSVIGLPLVVPVAILLMSKSLYFVILSLVYHLYFNIIRSQSKRSIRRSDLYIFCVLSYLSVQSGSMPDSVKVAVIQLNT